jgi:hypothetical protein
MIVRRFRMAQPFVYVNPDPLDANRLGDRLTDTTQIVRQRAVGTRAGIS